MCSGFEWLGLALDEDANTANAHDIAAEGSSIRVLVVPTDEEGMIARYTADLLGSSHE